MAEKKKEEKKKMVDVIADISSIVSQYGFDGAQDEGEWVDIGLKRNEGNPIVDSRVIDGFSVSFQKNYMILNYQSEIKIKDVHQPGFENETMEYLKKVVAFIKKEYRKLTNKTLSLTPQGEPKLLVQSCSRVRTWVQATQIYKIGGTEKEDDNKDAQKEKLDKAIESWLGAKEIM